jgi:hypothetical protein
MDKLLSLLTILFGLTLFIFKNNIKLYEHAGGATYRGPAVKSKDSSCIII